MNLIGVDFGEFACFERCFVPLNSGVQLLVGRNNSGKTALLRGLTALRALPFGNPDSLAPELVNYARPAALPSYSMDIYFDFEKSDEGLLADVLAWPDVKVATHLEWKFSFKVYPQPGAIVLVEAELLYDRHATKILEARREGLLRNVHNESGQVLEARGIPPTQSRSTLADGTNLLVYAPQELLSVFPTVMKARMVSAHRVVSSNYNLQALDKLADNAESLAPFLDTLLSNERETFDEIQRVVTEIFPEFKLVNPEKTQNNVFITLTRRESGRKIPLTHCGTGVEQVLALATAVLTAQKGTIILLDEPHSYLHPTAERQVIDFLLSHNEHRYVIATHSAVLMNAVEPNRILALTNTVIERQTTPNPPSAAQILHSLGYRNSDLLFSDRLIFVEGDSDQLILPILLSQNPKFAASDLKRTAFPAMDGEGKLRGKGQHSLLYWERFLNQLGRSSIPRIYLFDGDCVQDERKLLEKTSCFAAGTPALLRFLTVHEIENYLLVPRAIAATISELREFEALDPAKIEEVEIERQLTQVLSTKDNQKLYPHGSDPTPIRVSKGSVALELLFSKFGLRYDKKKTGQLLAMKINPDNQPLLLEIWGLVPPEFLQRRK